MSELDAVPGGGLYRPGQAADVPPVICVPFAPLVPSYPARPPLSGGQRRVRLSRVAALGRASRPAAGLSTVRRSPDSGLGRLHGLEGLNAFLETRHVEHEDSAARLRRGLVVPA